MKLSDLRAIVEKREWIAFIAAAANHFDKLLDLWEHAPKECICHVGAFDGHHGVTHSDYCNRYLAALEALDNA